MEQEGGEGKEWCEENSEVVRGRSDMMKRQRERGEQAV